MNKKKWSSGRFGIWLDSDLNHGRTDPCPTYGNPSLVSPPDFVIKTLEIFAFLSSTSNNMLMSSVTGDDQVGSSNSEDTTIIDQGAGDDSPPPHSE
jgi:hypothetical protein